MDGSFSYLLINEENIVKTSLLSNFDTTPSQVRITFFKVSLSAKDRPSNIESINSSCVFESLAQSSCSLLLIIDSRKKSGRFDKILMISSVGYFCNSSGISLITPEHLLLIISTLRDCILDRRPLVLLFQTANMLICRPHRRLHPF